MHNNAESPLFFSHLYILLTRSKILIQGWNRHRPTCLLHFQPRGWTGCRASQGKGISSQVRCSCRNGATWSSERPNWGHPVLDQSALSPVCLPLPPSPWTTLLAEQGRPYLWASGPGTNEAVEEWHKLALLHICGSWRSAKWLVLAYCRGRLVL